MLSYFRFCSIALLVLVLSQCKSAKQDNSPIEPIQVMVMLEDSLNPDSLNIPEEIIVSDAKRISRSENRWRLTIINPTTNSVELIEKIKGVEGVLNSEIITSNLPSDKSIKVKSGSSSSKQ